MIIEKHIQKKNGNKHDKGLTAVNSGIQCSLNFSIFDFFSKPKNIKLKYQSCE